MLPIIPEKVSEVTDGFRIRAQVEKIFVDSRFSGSVILKKFLQFVIEQKLRGKSHLLKEYTIAVEVLNKPKNFNPQENCIVRIHANRLRKVLADYYGGPGFLDDVRILLPKGHYIPLFLEIPKNKVSNAMAPSGISAEDHERAFSHHVVAVLPFQYAGSDANLALLAEGLGMGLCANLLKLKSVSVIPDYILYRPDNAGKAYSRLLNDMAPGYLIAGRIQRHKDITRVMVQMIRASNHELLWCHVYQPNMGQEALFQVQDEIAAQVVKAIRKLGLLSGHRPKIVGMSAVA